MVEDFERCYRFMRSRDPRYDGFFVVAVTSTRVYCRPSCPARLPKRANVRLFRTPAAAQAAGFRACKRCQPDAAPGSPEWNRRADVAGRALRLIADGVIDREGVSGLAARLGFSERHMHRMLATEVGAGPVALARAQRAQTARLLIESTQLSFAEIALAAGFGSIRQFNDTVREIYARTPSDLRQRASKRIGTATPGVVDVRLACRQPFDGTAAVAFLRDRAIAGLEEVIGPTYRRSLRLPHGGAVVELTPERRHVGCSLRLNDLRDLTAAVARCRRLLDLDADPAAVSELLGRDSVMRPLVARRPGLRVPGCVDGAELAIRALLGQQISTRSARSLLARMVECFGDQLGEPKGAVSRHFPTPQTLAAADAATFPMPRARADALQMLCRQLANGEITLDAGTDQDDALPRLQATRGIGPWTASYIAVRALGDPDVFLPTDRGIQRALQRLGHKSDPATAQRLSRGWRPWRSYAVLHLWSSLGDTPNHHRRETRSSPVA